MMLQRSSIKIFFLLFFTIVLSTSVLESVPQKVIVNSFALNIVKAYENPGMSYPDYSNQWRMNEQLSRLAIQSLVLSRKAQGLENLVQEYKNLTTADKLNILSVWISKQASFLAENGDKAAAKRVMDLEYVLIDSATANRLMGEFYRRLGDFENAEKYYLASSNEKNDPDLLISLGQLYVGRAKQLSDNYEMRISLYTKAKDSFLAAIKLDPGLGIEANYYLGSVFWQLNQRENAVQAYDFVVENGGIGHYAFLAYYYLGEIYSSWWKDKIDYPKAEVYFQNAYSRAQNNRERAMCLVALSKVNASQGRKNISEQYLRDAWHADPNYVSTLQINPSLKP